MSDVAKVFNFQRVDSPMSVAGYTRYSVFAAVKNFDFVGDVFLFYPDVDARSGRWLAHRRDGTIRGWLSPLRTRKAAAEALL